MNEVVLAVDAYGMGQVTGRTLFVVLGLALLRTGLAKRAASRTASPASTPPPVPAGAVPGQDRWSWMEAPAPVSAAVPATGTASPPAPAAPPLGDFFAAPTGSVLPAGPPGPAPTAWSPPAPQRSPPAGIAYLVAGGVLLAVGVVGLLLRFSPLGEVDRQVTMPSTVLGLPQDGTALDPSLGGLDRFLPGVDDVQAAVYGTPPAGVVVVAATGDVGDASAALDAMSADAALGEGTPVPAGRLGGEGRCWSTALAQTTSAVCGFADRGSVVVVLDLVQTDPAVAAARALEVREAVVG